MCLPSVFPPCQSRLLCREGKLLSFVCSLCDARLTALCGGFYGFPPAPFGCRMLACVSINTKQVSARRYSEAEQHQHVKSQVYFSQYLHAFHFDTTNYYILELKKQAFMCRLQTEVLYANDDVLNRRNRMKVGNFDVETELAFCLVE